MLASTLRGAVSQRLVPRPTGDGRVAVERDHGRHRPGPGPDPQPEETGKITQVIAEGEYYGMQTFDQSLLKARQRGRRQRGGGDGLRLEPARLQADARRSGRRASDIEQVHGAGERRPPRTPASPRRPASTPGAGIASPARPARLVPSPRERAALRPCACKASVPEALIATIRAMRAIPTAQSALRRDHLGQVDAAGHPRSRDGNRRFCELERSLEGISPRTLSLRLRALEECGVVERHTYPEVPPRVEYALTEKGRALEPLIDDMRDYGRRWLPATTSAAERAETVPRVALNRLAARIRPRPITRKHLAAQEGARRGRRPPRVRDLHLRHTLTSLARDASEVFARPRRGRARRSPTRSASRARARRSPSTAR